MGNAKKGNRGPTVPFLLAAGLALVLGSPSRAGQPEAPARPPRPEAAVPGTLWGWGYNGSGQIGDGTTTDRLSPIDLGAYLGDQVASVAAGEAFTLALDADGNLYACGYNFFGQLGDGTNTQRLTPVPVASQVYAIAAGRNHSLAISQPVSGHRRLYAWGNNSKGQLGMTGTSRNVPTEVPGLLDLVQVEAGEEHSLALAENGSLWVWGSNAYGQLGAGTTDSSSHPNPQGVSGLGQIVEIAAGYDHNLALRNDGTVWAWGNNYNGQVGDGTTTTRTAPVQVAGLPTIRSIAAGYAGSLAVGYDGSVWEWGWNGANTENHSPVRIGTYNGVVQAAAGYLFAAFVREDGSVYTWGRNTRGQLGDGTTTWRNTPAVVPGLPFTSFLAAGDYFALAVTNHCTFVSCDAATNKSSALVGEPVYFGSELVTLACTLEPLYLWDFGDGQTSTDSALDHAYSAPGSYDWAFSASLPGPETCSKQGTVVVAEALQALAGATPVSGPPPLEVAFTGSAAGGFPPYSYSWSFGDGGTSSVQNPSHTYTQAGAYTATLTATDAEGHTASSTALSIVAANPLTAGATASPASGSSPLTVTFGATAGGGLPPFTYQWTFGDGGTSSVQNPSHTYNQAGLYPVSLTIHDAAGQTAVDGHLSIQVTAPPPVVASIVKLQPFGLKVTGSNLQSGIRVFINGAEWSQVVWKTTTKIKLVGGKALKAVLPKGTTHTLRFVNPDGGETTTTWSY